MGGARHAAALDERAALADDAERSLRERRGQNDAEALLHVVRAGGEGDRPEQGSVRQAMHAQARVVTARDERATAEEGDVLGWRVGTKCPEKAHAMVVVDREPATVARRDQTLPLRGS